MKVAAQITLLVLLSRTYQLEARMSLKEYTARVGVEFERQYSPITENMCEKDIRFRNLKSCVLARTNKEKLRLISRKFMSPRLNYWQRRSVGIDVVDNPGIRNVLRSTYVGDRSKRSSEEDVLKGKIGLNRSKRDIPGNPCLRGKALRTTILYGVDALTGEILELFQDPERRLYQTFFTRKCSMRRFFSFRCVVQYVEYMTAVYKPDSYEVITRAVKIPTNCAINVGG